MDADCERRAEEKNTEQSTTKNPYRMFWKKLRTHTHQDADPGTSQQRDHLTLRGIMSIVSLDNRGKSQWQLFVGNPDAASIHNTNSSRSSEDLANGNKTKFVQETFFEEFPPVYPVYNCVRNPKFTKLRSRWVPKLLTAMKKMNGHIVPVGSLRQRRETAKSSHRYIMVTVFWVKRGVLLMDFKPREPSINEER
ncbi:hypothetical protein J6590_039133 [Homalodisca vitripennis]|nr:hypothetical protein J6590_039133 [Homalodisca vitripennis]